MKHAMPIVKIFVFLSFLSASGLLAQGYDPNPAWPLCGNYYKTSPSATYCPSSRWGSNYTDLINDTYGPRLSISSQYDWHRGLDLHTDNADGRPVFAITCGKVKTVKDVYNGEVVIEHYPNHDCTEDGLNFPTCGSVGGCYYSRYKHLSDATVSVGQKIKKGSKIGESGRNCNTVGCSAYPHVHFEIRQAPGSHDAYGRGQRDAIHPLNVLPYDNTDEADNITLSIPSVDTTDPFNPQAEVHVTIPNDGIELDLVRIEVQVFRNLGFMLEEIAQPNPAAAYPTPEGNAYEVHPAFFDMELWSRQYNYKNNSKLPYEDFLSDHFQDIPTDDGNTDDGPYMSPFSDPNFAFYDSNFPTSYNADYHLEANKGSTEEHIGDFNGVEVEALNFNRLSSSYELELLFKHLTGVPNAAELCIKAFGVDAHGKTTDPDDATWGTCDPTF